MDRVRSIPCTDISAETEQCLKEISRSGTVRRVVYPYHPSLARRIAQLFALNTSLAGNLIFYHHNPFEIFCYFEDLSPESTRSLRHISPKKRERFFLQAMALYQIECRMNTPLFDFSRISVGRTHELQVEFYLNDRPHPDSAGEISRHFRGPGTLQELKPDNLGYHWEVLRDRSSGHLEKQYFYDHRRSLVSPGFFDEILDRQQGVHAVGVTRSDPGCQAMIKRFLIKACHDRKIRYREISLPDEDWERAAFPAKDKRWKSSKNDYDRSVLVISGHDRRDVLPSIQRHCRARSDEGGYILVDMARNNRLKNCEICIHRFPNNELGKEGRTSGTPDKKITGRERETLKFFCSFPLALPRNVLPKILAEDQMKQVARLQKDLVLRETRPGWLALHESWVDRVKVSLRESINFHQKFLQHHGHPGVRLHLSVLQGNTRGIIRFLASPRLQYQVNPQDYIPILEIRRSRFREDNRMMEHFLDLLVREERLALAGRLLVREWRTDDVFHNTKMAHIALIKKDYQLLDRYLDRLEEAGGSDEILFLKSARHLKKSQFDPARFLSQKIENPYYRSKIQLMVLHLSIIKGEPVMEKDIRQIVRYFAQNGYRREEIEARHIQAKLLKDNRFEQAGFHRECYIQSAERRYSLLCASVAVDLGNLYYHADRYTTSRVWYQRALELFKEAGNENGVFLVYSNLNEINKILGNWHQIKERGLQILSYDRRQQKQLAVAHDYYNLAEFEYLKHAYETAVSYADRARDIFSREDYADGEATCMLLKWMIFKRIRSRDALVESGNLPEGTTDPDLRRSFSVLKCLAGDDPQTAARCHRILEKFDSRLKKFHLSLVVTAVLRDRTSLAQLEMISRQLTRDNPRNYFYYEYKYLYFDCFVPADEPASRLNRDLFEEVYWFFKRNGRHLSPKMEFIKRGLDGVEGNFQTLLDLAHLVQGFGKWQSKEDITRTIDRHLGPRSGVSCFCFSVFCRGQIRFRLSNRPQWRDLYRLIDEKAITGNSPFDLSAAEVDQLRSRIQLEGPESPDMQIQTWPGSGKHQFVFICGLTPSNRREDNIFNSHRRFFHELSVLVIKFLQNREGEFTQLTEIIGRSEPIRRMKQRIMKVARVPFPVLITGESGTGKELVARAIASLGIGKGGDYFCLNTATLPENLMEAELFGYRKGAFTGAQEDRSGLIEAAAGGCLFLDEIGELPLKLQAKLLRVLQEKEIKRLGENRTRKVSVRFIFATNRDLKRMIGDGRFREDLYYRIRDLEIRVPPLRERKEDISLLVEYFLKEGGMDVPAEEMRLLVEGCKLQDWRGNVRELRSYINRFITFYPDFSPEDRIMDFQPAEGLIGMRDRFEREILENRLVQNRWNRQKTARELKISRNHLYQLIKKHDLRPFPR